MMPVNFMHAGHADNHRVTLVVSHAWMTTNMDIKTFAEACELKFGALAKKMKNAAFSVRVPNNGISPAVTLYAPKTDTRFRVHITGVKNFQHISSTMELLREVIQVGGHSVSFARPEIDLVNLRYRVDNMRIRSVPVFIRTSCHDWVASLEELKSGKPINISNENCTILLWSSGSSLVMVKRLRADEDFDARLQKSADLLARIRRHCDAVHL